MESTNFKQNETSNKTSAFPSLFKLLSFSQECEISTYKVLLFKGKLHEVWPLKHACDPLQATLYACDPCTAASLSLQMAHQQCPS